MCRFALGIKGLVDKETFIKDVALERQLLALNPEFKFSKVAERGQELCIAISLPINVIVVINTDCHIINY